MESPDYNVDLIETPEERAEYVAFIVLVQAYHGKNLDTEGIILDNNTIRATIKETGWGNITVQIVLDVIYDTGISNAAELQNFLVSTYEKFSRDYGITYPDIHSREELVMDDYDEDLVEMAMSFNELTEFCESAKVGDRCRFLSVDDDMTNGITANEIKARLNNLGFAAGIFPEQTRNCYMVIFAGNLTGYLLKEIRKKG